MAWRIERVVLRGEIDNRTRGRVTGRLWLLGRAEPLALDLVGDCHRDLAGRRLEFTNPRPEPDAGGELDLRQHGRAGDITASRKVRVPDIPLDDIREYDAARTPFPWHWGNALYLEWFNEANGRVVIESADFELRIVGEPTWEMTEAEEQRQREAAAEALNGFLADLNAAVAADAPAPEHDPESPAPPAADLPASAVPTEEQADRALHRSELLADRVSARLARVGADPDLEQIIAEEIERLRLELGEPEPPPGEREAVRARLAELSREVDAAFDAADSATARERHPLAERAFDLCVMLNDEAYFNRWIPENAPEEHPVADLVRATERAAAKLDSALSGGWPPPLLACAGVVAQLKRARIYLDDALRTTESCQAEKLIPNTFLGPILVELIDLAHDADLLIAELRDRLADGA